MIMKRLLTRLILLITMLTSGFAAFSQPGCAGNTTKPTFNFCPTGPITLFTDASACSHQLTAADAAALYPTGLDDCSPSTFLSFTLTVVGPGLNQTYVDPVLQVDLPPLNKGNNFFQWTLTDGQGNTALVNCDYIVVIKDNVPPSLTCTSNKIVNANASCKYTHGDLTWNPSVSDNCGILSYGYTLSGAGASPSTGTSLSGVQFNLGTTTVTWTATDNASPANTSTCSFTVTVLDVTPPVPTVAVLPGLSNQCSVTPTAPTALDNCPASGTSITGTTNTTFPITTQGVTTVIWTYTDGSGNTTTQTQIVTIDDITAPVPTLAALPDITAQCTVSAPTPPTASDNCDPTITGTTSTSFPITSQGTTVITWIYDDGNGNTTTQTQNVIIDDITAPVANVPSLTTVTEQCSANPSAPTATDNCVGSVIATTSTSMPITASTTIT